MSVKTIPLVLIIIIKVKRAPSIPTTFYDSWVVPVYFLMALSALADLSFHLQHLIDIMFNIYAFVLLLEPDIVFWYY